MDYQVVVIGSGPGGYVAAIRCAQLGMKTAIIEKYNTLGGTCLNVGCIPSKALLDSSEHFHAAEHTFKTHGIDINKPKVNLKQMINRKAEVVKQNVEGIDYLMKKNKIDIFHGFGSFLDQHTIKIEGKETKQITAEKVIIATGSKPSGLPFIELDKERVITSTEAHPRSPACNHVHELRVGKLTQFPHADLSVRVCGLKRHKIASGGGFPYQLANRRHAFLRVRANTRGAIAPVAAHLLRIPSRCIKRRDLP